MGGHKISKGSNYGTSGFVVVTSSGQRYLSSAGHVVQQFWQTAYYDGNSNIPLTGVGYHISSPIDAGYYASQEQKTNLIQDSPTTTRRIYYIEAYNSMWIGEWVFKYGQSTGNSMGVVSSKTYNGQFVLADSMSGQPIAAGGDSGSPVYRENIAIGILDGVPALYPLKMYYSAVSFMPAYFGFSVLTSQ